MTFATTFYSKFPDGECKVCGKKWGKGDEIGYIKKEGEKDRVCVDPNCGQSGPTVADVEQVQNPPQVRANLDEYDDGTPIPDPYANCIEGCVRAAEFFKSIDYPKELWGLTQIWNTERIKRK